MMRKNKLLVFGILMFLAGAALGWFIARKGLTRATPVPTYRLENDELLTSGPPWQDWQYPGSRIHSSGTNNRAKIGGIGFGSEIRVVMDTPDDFDTVWNHYQKMNAIREPSDNGTSPQLQKVNFDETSPFTVFDETRAHSMEWFTSESVQAKGFSVQTLRYSLIAFVYRPKDRHKTCIIISYKPHIEFIDLLNEKLQRK
jgi:hypothetical protein